MNIDNLINQEYYDEKAKQRAELEECTFWFIVIGGFVCLVILIISAIWKGFNHGTT